MLQVPVLYRAQQGTPEQPEKLSYIRSPHRNGQIALPRPLQSSLRPGIYSRRFFLYATPCLFTFQRYNERGNEVLPQRLLKPLSKADDFCTLWQKASAFLRMTGGLFMLASLAFIFLTGLLLSALSEKMRLPGIVGMIAAGVLLGRSGLNLLDASMQGISAPLRQMALVILLIRAGLSLFVSELKKVDRPAPLMAFVPAGFELTGYVLFAPLLPGVARVEAALMDAGSKRLLSQDG